MKFFGIKNFKIYLENHDNFLKNSKKIGKFGNLKIARLIRKYKKIVLIH
jgi:hypothetical protein